MVGSERYVVSALACLACCVLSVLLLPTPASATYPGANGEVIFQSNRDGDNEIYLLNADGSGLTKLTENTAADLEPVWSPDGQKIAFQSNRDGSSDVWVMDADGSDQARLTDDPAFDGAPSWSPDGTRIAFTSQRDGDDEIFAMDADGSSEVQLTVNGATDEDPAWGLVSSQDRIFFTSDRDGNEEIYSMFANAGDQTNLTTDPAVDREPNWLDGRIAFVTDRGLEPGDTDLDVFRMGTNGFAPSFVTDDTGVDQVAPVQSPDLQRIAYEQVGADREIYVATSDGQYPVNITNAATNERNPDWRAVPNTDVPYVRPKSAPVLHASLVISYTECISPNREHGPPLAFGSCAPPTPGSPNVTTGTPTADGSGAATNMTGSVRIRALPGMPGPPEDSDIAITASITDVRCAIRNINIYPFPCGPPNSAQQNDYVGELQGSVGARVTDRWNSTVPAGGMDRATTSNFAQEVTIPCQATASTSIGGHCSVSTSLNTLAPGSVLDTKRAVWELGQMMVYDAGPDGTVGNADGRELFAVQGVFVP